MLLSGVCTTPRDQDEVQCETERTSVRSHGDSPADVKEAPSVRTKSLQRGGRTRCASLEWSIKCTPNGIWATSMRGLFIQWRSSFRCF